VPRHAKSGVFRKPLQRAEAQAMYEFTTTLGDSSFEQTLQKTVEVLKAGSFGVLSDIDVQAAMKDTLGVERPTRPA